MVVYAFGLSLEELVVFLGDQLKVIMFWFCTWRGLYFSALVTEIERARAEVFSVCGIHPDLLEIAVGVVTDFDLIAPEFWVDAVESVIDADIGKGSVYGSGNAFHEELDGNIHVDMPQEGNSQVVALFWGLICFRVDSCVINDGKVGGEGLVEVLKGDDITGADFRFKLGLAGAEESLDQTSWGRVAWGSVDKFYAKGITGRA